MRCAALQAVLPFLDPVTANKVVFVGKGKGEAAVMDANFHMEDMEACLGGRGDLGVSKGAVREVLLRRGDSACQHSGMRCVLQWCEGASCACCASCACFRRLCHDCCLYPYTEIGLCYLVCRHC